MAKDPAINWYFDNWIGGTKGFNRFQKGCYFDLLTMQYYCGPLSLEQIKNELGQDFHVWDSIKRKFNRDECGNYYNERLAAEIRKRAKYSESRSNNRKKKTHDSSHDDDMINICGDIPGIETETSIESKIGGLGERKETWNQYPKSSDLGELPLTSLNDARQRIYLANYFAPPDSIIISFWDTWKAATLNGSKFYQSKDEVYSHFVNVIKKERFKQPETNSSTTSNGYSSAEERAKKTREKFRD